MHCSNTQRYNIHVSFFPRIATVHNLVQKWKLSESSFKHTEQRQSDEIRICDAHRLNTVPSVADNDTAHTNVRCREAAMTRAQNSAPN